MADSQIPPGAPDRIGRARQALAAARTGARPDRPRSTRPASPARPDQATEAEPDQAAESRLPGSPAQAARPPRSRRRTRRDDPQPLGEAIDALVADEGWTLAMATGSVFGRWAEIVGADLALHTTPESLSDGELTVAADSTAWATQLRLLAGPLVRQLNAELGDGSVVRVKIRGPGSSPRTAGQWRVRGSRGPGDTYG